MESPHILCINIADAKERWKSIQRQVANHLPHWPLHRIEATHWRNLPPQLQGIPMTPFTRYLVLNAERQTIDRISHRQMDTVSSVAIMLSHIACWQWMVEHPEVSAVLILEDDACFEGSHFTAAILETVQPLLSPKLLPLWDHTIAYPTPGGGVGHTLSNGMSGTPWYWATSVRKGRSST